jgi:hypothetical protein
MARNRIDSKFISSKFTDKKDPTNARSPRIKRNNPLVFINSPRLSQLDTTRVLVSFIFRADTCTKTEQNMNRNHNLS